MGTKMKTLEALAGALGVHVQTIYKWKRRPEWPFSPPYDVEAVRWWRATHVREVLSSADRVVKEKVETQLKLEQTLLTRKRRVPGRFGCGDGWPDT